MMLPLCYEPDRQSTADYMMKTYWNPRLAASIGGVFLLSLLAFAEAVEMYTEQKAASAIAPFNGKTRQPKA